MTVFAGFIRLRNATANVGNDADLRVALAAALSRNPADEPKEYDFGQCYMAKMDIEVFGGAGAYRETVSGSMLVGDPIIRERVQQTERTRYNDLIDIHEELLGEDPSALMRTRGSFCVAHYNGERNYLILATDKAGLRPLYYWMDENYVVFASALRILEGLRLIRKDLCLRGMADLACFGTELDDRSPYVGVKRLRAGEMVRISESGARTSYYWSWNEIPEAPRAADHLSGTGAKVFSEAVWVRIGADKEALSLLTGGLDSRTIVALLRERDVEVRSINFSVAGSQDQLFARLFAQRAETHHEEKPFPDGTAYPDISAWLSAHLRSRGSGSPLLKSGQKVWHGFDGSFTMGFVHVRPEIVELLRQDRIHEAAKTYAFRKHVRWPRSTRPRYAVRLESMALEAIENGFSTYRSPDPGRRFYLFHLLQEARSLLREHFEDIDRWRIEYLTPFFDMDFLRFMAMVPIEQCFNHQMYMRILEHYPPWILSVPWQTYPGHLPCPLPIPTALKGKAQWDPLSNEAIQFNRHLGDVYGWEILTGGYFPRTLISPINFVFIYLLHRSRLSDFLYAFKRIKILQRYLRVAEGRIGESR